MAKKSNPLKTFNDAYTKRATGLKKAQDGIQALNLDTFKGSGQDWYDQNIKAGNTPVFPDSAAGKAGMGAYPGFNRGTTTKNFTAAPSVSSAPIIKNDITKSVTPVVGGPIKRAFPKI